MARIIFELPERFGFHTDLQVYISHVNQGGHLDNAQLLSLVSEARVRFFRSLGYAEADVAGLSTVVGDMLDFVIVRTVNMKAVTGHRGILLGMIFQRG